MMYKWFGSGILMEILYIYVVFLGVYAMFMQGVDMYAFLVYIFANNGFRNCLPLSSIRYKII